MGNAGGGTVRGLTEFRFEHATFGMWISYPSGNAMKVAGCMHLRGRGQVWLEVQILVISLLMEFKAMKLEEISGGLRPEDSKILRCGGR